MPQLRLRDLVIASGATESNALDWQDLRNVRAITLFAPSSLSGTVTVEVTHVREPAAADWVAFQVGGSDLTLTADKALLIDYTPFQGLRLSTTMAPVADEEYGVVGEEAGGSFQASGGY